ncbi:MAG: hypothetical protein AB1486_24360 [Planctomycetota bacterium]
MTESSSSCGKEEPPKDDLAGNSATLRLPAAPEFHSQRAPVSLEMILALSEERLPLVNAWPDFEERRLRTKCREPFVLM